MTARAATSGSIPGGERSTQRRSPSSPHGGSRDIDGQHRRRRRCLASGALIEYFRNKSDIFVSAFVALFEDHADLALGSLHADGTTSERLDGFLQRFEGDLWERLAASPHAEEIMNTKPAHAVKELQQVISRLRDGLEAFLTRVAPGRSRAAVDQRHGWADVLVLAPKGFKSDTPNVTDYRRRLTALAHSVAADIDA